MAKLGDLNAAGHAYAPGHDPETSGAILKEWASGTLAPSDTQLAVAAGLVVVLLVGRGLLRFLSTRHRGF